ncbi:PAS domain-containing sensor histidine kinase [bacterium]|nr:PAS domain-containing sensor histidine kinase [bacterium]
MFIEDATNIVESIRSGNLSKKIGKINSSSGDSLAESLNQLIDSLKETEENVRKQQDELLKQNRFLESVLNSLSDGLIIVDKNTKIVKVTPKISNWFGQNSKKLIGQDLFDFIEPLNQAPIENLHSTGVYIKTYSSDLFEATALRLNIEDKSSRYIVLIKNVTNQKELEKLKEDFVATLTHDLKVPIVAESNMLDFLMNETFGEINDKQRDVLNKMKGSNSELIELVQMLLDTYKSNNTEIELYKEDTDMNEFLAETIDEMKPVAEKQNINLNFISPQNTTLKIDKLQFKRVVKNLIQNALSYSESSNDVDIKTNVQGGNVFISVIDYGKGISSKDIDLIFNKYYSTSKRYRKVGTGLGLYLSKQIVEAHNGEISVTSEEGVLTEFKIKLDI